MSRMQNSKCIMMVCILAGAERSAEAETGQSSAAAEQVHKPAQQNIATGISGHGKAAEIARGLAMHTVGMQTGWIKAEDIPQEVIDKELDIYKTQALNEGKPEAAIEKMLPGKVKKFAKENCLLEQGTIKDNKKTIR